MSSLKYFTRRSALNAATKFVATTDFNHLRSFPRAWLIRRTKHDPKLKSVRPADRIKWWNIVPGDRICLRGDADKTVHEVLSINRLSNRVFLKNTQTVRAFSCVVDCCTHIYLRPRNKASRLKRRTIITRSVSSSLDGMSYRTLPTPQDPGCVNRTSFVFKA